MTKDKELQALVDYKGEQGVLSVYLDTDLADKSKDAVKLMFRERMRELQEQAQAEIESVKEFLDYEYDWQSKGLAVFSADEALWRVVYLPVPVESRAVFSERPYLRPLSDVLDRFSRYSVALVDRESLQLFSVDGGKIQPETETFGEELKRHKQGGWAAARYQRHEENLALHNLKHAADIVESFLERAEGDGLVLAGSSEILAQFRKLLPPSVQEKVLGEFSIGMEAPADQVLDMSLDVARQADLKRERELVQAAITAAAKGDPGATGLSDTLYALYQGRVRTLLVDENYYQAGWVCANCGHVLIEAAEECPLCHHQEILETQDIVDLAIHKAIETGAEVNIVRGNEKLAEAGGVAATLRY